MVVAPFDHLWVDVAAEDTGARQAGPVAQYASATAAPVEECVPLLDRRTRVEEQVSDQLRVVLAAAEEELGVRVQRADLGPQASRRQRQPVRGPGFSPEERGSRGERELVGAHGRSCEVQPVEEVEQASSAAPSRWLGHKGTVSLYTEDGYSRTGADGGPAGLQRGRGDR